MAQKKQQKLDFYEDFLLDGVFADSRTRQLCGFPSVTERAEFFKSVSEFGNIGLDFVALASDEHTKGFTYADMVSLQRNASSCAAHTALLGMSKESILSAAAKDGAREIDLSDLHVAKDDVMRAMKTMKPSFSDEERDRYYQWNP